MTDDGSEDADDVDRATVHCGKCGSPVPDPAAWLHEPELQQRSCPMCGAVGRGIAEIFASDTAQGYEFAERKSKVQGKKKPRSELQVGDQLAVTAGRYVKKRRLIDRDADWYEETVVDPETGDVLHSCAEPLSDHLGHGSDRARE